ncbi:Fc.00g080350.m01.CDS01 [Cosmosporella sp. VM-42]
MWQNVVYVIEGDFHLDPEAVIPKKIIELSRREDVESIHYGRHWVLTRSAQNSQSQQIDVAGDDTLREIPLEILLDLIAASL